MKYHKLLSLCSCIFWFSFQSKVLSQNSFIELPPKFSNCAQTPKEQLRNCFFYEVQNHVYQNFKAKDSISITIQVLFNVDKQGRISTFYTDAPTKELREEVTRVFNLFPIIQPGTHAGKPAEQQFRLQIVLPLKKPQWEIKEETKPINNQQKLQNELTEYENLVYQDFQDPVFDSNLDVPFSHQNYAVFDPWMNLVGANNHTASKPYTNQEVQKYFDLNERQQSLQKNKSGWWGKKWWNENMVRIQGEGYWFTLDPVADLRLGRDFSSDFNYTYQNTRAVRIQGGIGKQLHFYTNLYESQGRFADYYNFYANSIRPSGGNPGIIPGIGIAKEFKTNGFDFPLAEANITYTPNSFINLQLGYQRNFIGDGYRSLILSDGASPYPFFKINTTFWKIKYTNLYTWMKDVRPEVTVDRTYATKFMAAHYLSWNVTKRWNLGFFESVVWGNDNNRGFDASFWNPIIFYRAVEFTSSSRSGNALLALTSKYKWNNQLQFYGQFLLDEFALGDVTGVKNSWRNKFAYQIGTKWFQPFGIENLTIQAEYNHVRPYVYSHSNVLTNYGHSNQSLGHQWGGNTKEFVLIGRYFKDRWFADAKLQFAVRGMDFDSDTDNFNYGANIYKNYDEDRPFDANVIVGQGNKTNVFIAELQGGYLVNPATNLKIFGHLLYRNFSPQTNTATVFSSNTTWFSIGLRTDLFNLYLDY